MNNQWKWYPIEIAPIENEEWILAYQPATKYQDECINKVAWIDNQVNYPGNHKPFFCWCVYGSFQDEQGGWETMNPTHWTRLPNPPT